MARGVKGSGAAHQTRETKSRAANRVHAEEQEPWRRGASLEMPPAQPGMDQRWILFDYGGPDRRGATNYGRKFREGWRPRKAETVSDDFEMPRMDTGHFAGCIVVEGSVLCERPMSLSKRRQKHVEYETKRRTDAINADLQRTNAANRSPGFGPIQMATKAVRVREVVAAPDE